MLGPTLIHYKKTFSTYLFFASCVISLNNYLKASHAFGADGEVPLADAFSHKFKEAIKLTCFNHMRQNIKDKMRRLAIPEERQSVILNDIFGKQIGSTLLTGLVDSKSVATYEQKVVYLMEKWSLYDDTD